MDFAGSCVSGAVVVVAVFVAVVVVLLFPSVLLGFWPDKAQAFIGSVV